jgi:hypothetical protein
VTTNTIAVHAASCRPGDSIEIWTDPGSPWYAHHRFYRILEVYYESVDVTLKLASSRYGESNLRLRSSEIVYVTGRIRNEKTEQ